MTKPWVHLQENWESPGARDTNAKRVASPADGARAVNEPLPGSLRVGSFELSLWRRSVGPDAHYVPLLCAPICPMTIRGSLDYGSGVISVPYSSLRRGVTASAVFGVRFIPPLSPSATGEVSRCS